MDLKQVENILEKYWEGTSSREDERLLRDFFSYAEVPAHLEPYKELFIVQEVDLNPALGKAFDEELKRKILVADKPKTSWTLFRIAAIGLILIITAISVFKADQKTQVAEDTFSNPEEALAETKKAFILIAEAMNKGEEPVQNIIYFDKANEKIKKN
jgi:hypothetical protein